MAMGRNSPPPAYAGRIMMPRSMKLSILDQSPIIAGHSAGTGHRGDPQARAPGRSHWAITATGSPSTTPSARSPIPARRSCSRGWARKPGASASAPAGVLLPYYSALKVAEVFRMLEALYPGRVDLGIGRAPGGDQRTARAVGGGRMPTAEDFPQQVWELVGYLDGTLPDDHPFKARAARSRAARPRPKSGCSAPPITAACSPRSWACALPSRISSTRTAATW